MTETTHVFDKMMRKLKLEATKFTIVGAANFMLTFVVFYTMLKAWSVNYVLSLAVAWILGMFFSYVVNFVWVFKPERKIQFRDRFFKFFIASVVSIALNILLLSYIVERTKFDPFYVQAALIPFLFILNFTTAKLWSLREISPK